MDAPLHELTEAESNRDGDLDISLDEVDAEERGLKTLVQFVPLDRAASA